MPTDLATLQPPEAKKETQPAQFVSEAEYWEKYYEADIVYEWNDGKLEEKPVSDWQTWLIYQWFLEMLFSYLRTHKIAQIVGLDMGFRMVLPNKKKVIRKPDLGIIRLDNPNLLQLEDRTYPGIFDMCVEALSDADPNGVIRDTVEKKNEYAAAGVQEYYILHHEPRYHAFYQLSASGVYQPIPTPDGIVRSQVLPKFQFRIADLLKRPDIESLIHDPIYKHFAMLTLQESIEARRQAEQVIQDTKQRVKEAEQRAATEKQARHAAEQQAATEKQARHAAEQQVATEKQARYAAEQQAEASKLEVARLSALLAKQNHS